MQKIKKKLQLSSFILYKQKNAKRKNSQQKNAKRSYRRTKNTNFQDGTSTLSTSIHPLPYQRGNNQKSLLCGKSRNPGRREHFNFFDQAR